MIFNLSLLFLLSQDLAGAYQSNPVRDILVLDEGVSGEFIGDYFYYAKDKEYQWTIADFQDSALANSFIKSEFKRSNFGNEELAIWNRLTVTNQTDRKWLFDISVYTIDTLTVFYPNKDGTYRKIDEGRAFPFRDKKYKSNSFLFDLDIPKGDTVTIYVRVSAFIMQYPSKVYLKDDYINMAHKRDLLSGLFLGILLLTIFYNLFIWLATRDDNYLYFTVYAFFGSIFVFELSGLASEIVFPGPLSVVTIHGPIIVAVASITSVAFSIKFLETRQRVQRIDLFLRYFIIPVLVLAIIFDLLNYRIVASLINQLIGVIAIFVISAAAVYSYKSGLRSSIYFLIAKFFNFTGVLLFILKTVALLPYTIFFNLAIEIGLSLEMIIFSFALAGKINQYKDEKELAIRRNQKLIEEQNEILERTVTERTTDLNIEKDKSEKLLLNILPKDIAEELKASGEVKAKTYESLSILISDFKNFTQISEGLEADQLIAEINKYFKEFDTIVANYNVEKIKTMGDAYMAASGFNTDSKKSLEDIVRVGLQMQKFVEDRAGESADKAGAAFQMRVGIHIGPVVAGVVGTRKFQYDLWGDTVNTAARMETHGEVGQVNVSESVYRLLEKDPDFTFEIRELSTVKGKGKMTMYFVKYSNNHLTYAY